MASFFISHLSFNNVSIRSDSWDSENDFVKIQNDKLLAACCAFRHYRLCNDLDVDPKYPLMFVYGKFDPIDRNQYNAEDWFMLLTGINNWSECHLPEKYEFDTTYEVETNISEASYN